MKLSYKDMDTICAALAAQVHKVLPLKPQGHREYRAFGIPRGGIFAGLALTRHLNLLLTDEPEEADFFIDDILDSGETKDKWCARYPGKPFFVLVNKKEMTTNEWVSFPWESASQANESIEGNVTRILQYIGEDPHRGGLLDTPLRVTKAWKNYWAAGYNVDVASLMKTFEDGVQAQSQMILVKNIPFYSHCEHHMAPFFGRVTIAYLPKDRILGLSKFARVVKAFSQRLQVQERLTDQIADAVFEHLKPLGVGVFVTARHLCMESRGIEQQGHHTETTALRGVFLSEDGVRQEFLGRLN